MLFGRADSLAIEAELLEVSGKWIYGKLRFWIGGAEVGDFDDTSDLATSARWGRSFLAASRRRTRADLDHQSPGQVYDLLYGRFVVDLRGADRVSITAAAEPWDRDPYVLDDVGESALRDRFAMVIVRRGDGRDRIIVKSFADGSISEAVSPPGVCDSVVDSYCRWVESLAPGGATRA